MMETKTYCDHCGKELDAMKDYTEISIDIPTDIINADLCVSCYNGLIAEISEYLTNSKGGAE